MSEPFIAEIRILAFSFAPQGWAFCDGQLLPIAQNTALFSLLGTIYGGDGESNFALPNLQGRAPMHAGTGPGLSPRSLGQRGGAEQVTLLPGEMPAHSHPLQASSAAADEEGQKSPAAAVPGEQEPVNPLYGTLPGSPTTMAQEAIGNAGSGAAHNSLQPYLTVNFCIAMQGIYPTSG